MKTLTYLLRQNLRVLGQLALALVVLAANPYVEYGQPVLFFLVLRKAALVAVGAALAHLTWKNLMYYAHTREMLTKWEGSEAAIKYLGLNVFRGFYYLAWILGVATGL